MQKNNPNNYTQDDEINLRGLLDLLIDSKKIIIVITIICTLIAAIYSSSFMKARQVPIYQSSAKLTLGHYDNKLIQNISDVRGELFFFFEGITPLSFEKFGKKVSSFRSGFIIGNAFSGKEESKVRQVFSSRYD
mgnify:CR=1 FL=1